MKKSKAVPLFLLGSSALLAGCRHDQQHQETRQDAYSTIEACDRDWVDDECVRSGGGVYLGPRYFYSHDNHTPYVIDRNGRTRAMPSHYGAYNSYGAGISGAPAMSADRTTIVSRGGFGSGRGGFSSGG